MNHHISQHYEGASKTLKGELRRTASNIRSGDYNYQFVIVRRIPEAST